MSKNAATAPLPQTRAPPPQSRAPPPSSQVLDDKNCTELFRMTSKAADKWRAIGIFLGFETDDLDRLVREPGRYGDEDFYAAMLRKWLDWAPPKHTHPTIGALVAALRSVGKEKLANELEQKGCGGGGGSGGGCYGTEDNSLPTYTQEATPIQCITVLPAQLAAPKPLPPDQTPSPNPGTEDLPLYTCCTIKKPKDICKEEDKRAEIEAVSIIIQACNKYELQASAEQMDDNFIKVQCSSGSGMSFYLGKFAKIPCALIITEQGEKCKEDIEEVLNVCKKASLIIGIGVCCGLDLTLELGDVIVSTSIQHLDAARVEDMKIKPRGDCISVSKKVKKAFALSDLYEWNFKCSEAGRESKAVVGKIVSGPYLTDSKIWTEAIKKGCDDVKGLEMEGGVLQDIAIKKNICAVVIKGVSDFGGAKGSKTKEWQCTAAKAAAHYAKTRLLSNPIY